MLLDNIAQMINVGAISPYHLSVAGDVSTGRAEWNKIAHAVFYLRDLLPKLPAELQNRLAPSIALFNQIHGAIMQDPYRTAISIGGQDLTNLDSYFTMAFDKYIAEKTAEMSISETDAINAVAIVNADFFPRFQMIATDRFNELNGLANMGQLDGDELDELDILRGYKKAAATSLELATKLSPSLGGLVAIPAIRATESALKKIYDARAAKIAEAKRLADLEAQRQADLAEKERLEDEKLAYEEQLREQQRANTLALQEQAAQTQALTSAALQEKARLEAERAEKESAALDIRLGLEQAEANARMELLKIQTDTAKRAAEAAALNASTGLVIPQAAVVVQTPPPAPAVSNASIGILTPDSRAVQQAVAEIPVQTNILPSGNSPAPQPAPIATVQVASSPQNLSPAMPAPNRNMGETISTGGLSIDIETEEEKRKKMYLYIGIGVAVLALMGGVGYYFYQKNEK